MSKERLRKIVTDKRNVAIEVLSVALIVTFTDDIKTRNNVRKVERLKKEKEVYKEYLDLINNSKSYYNMTEEEREQIDLLIDGGFNKFVHYGNGNYKNVSDGVYNSFSNELKTEYKEGYDRVVKDRGDSLAKIQAEEEERKAKDKD